MLTFRDLVGTETSQFHAVVGLESFHPARQETTTRRSLASVDLKPNETTSRQTVDHSQPLSLAPHQEPSACNKGPSTGKPRDVEAS